MNEVLPVIRPDVPSALPALPAQTSGAPLGMLSASWVDLAEVVFRHKTKIVAFFLAVVGSATIVLLLSGKTYTSEAKLMVRQGRESAAMDPSAMTGAQMYPVYREWDSILNSELEILRSRELLEKTIEEFGLARMLSGGGKPLGKGMSEDPTNLALALEKLQKHLQIELYRKSNIISVRYSTSTPELARDVVARVIELYLAKHLTVHQTLGTFDFFVRQTEEMRKQVEQKETELQNLQQTSGIISLDEQLPKAVERANVLRDRLGQISAQRAASTAKTQMIGALLQPKKGALAVSRLTTEDYKEMQKTLLHEESTLTGLKAEAGELEKELQAAERALQQVSDTSTRYLRLQREHGVLVNLYRTYSENLEQARINRELDKEKISNISIVQAPEAPLLADPSGRMLKLLLAILFGAAGSVGLAFLCETLDRTLKNPSDVAARLNLRTLVTIPVLDSAALDASVRQATQPDGGATARPERKMDPDEYFAVLAARVLRQVVPASAATPIVLGVTSCEAGEGVTSVAANLAVALARRATADRVVYVDASFQRQTPHQVFGMTQGGAAELVTDAEGQLHVLTRNHYLPDQPLPDGKRPTPPAEVLTHWVSTLRQADCRFAVFDMPPVSQGLASMHLAGLMDGLILVIEAERIRREIVQRAMALLEEAPSHILGVVLNKRKCHVPEWICRLL